MGNKSYFTYKRAEQEEILKKIEENYKLLWNMWKKYGRMGEGDTGCGSSVFYL